MIDGPDRPLQPAHYQTIFHCLLQISISITSHLQFRNTPRLLGKERNQARAKNGLQQALSMIYLDNNNHCKKWHCPQVLVWTEYTFHECIKLWGKYLSRKFCHTFLEINSHQTGEKSVCLSSPLNDLDTIYYSSPLSLNVLTIIIMTWGEEDGGRSGETGIGQRPRRGRTGLGTDAATDAGHGRHHWDV